MPSFYDQLKEAQLENVSGDKGTLSRGLIWLDTSLSIPKPKYYDGTTIRTVGIGSGGGGGSLLWVPDEAGPGPVEAIEFAQKVWRFTQNSTQKLFTVVKVPNSYSAGDPITMRINIYSPDTSGTALIQGLATLIRTGTDGFESLINQRTTTNSAVTFSVSANIPRAVSLDISSSTGTINSVAIAAGDLIKVQLSRASGTSVSETRFVESSTEVTFS